MVPRASPKKFMGDGFRGTQTHIIPKFSFSSDCGHFIMKMLENAKNTCQEKKILKYPNIDLCTLVYIGL